jgi:hypothetical protein
MNAGDPVSNVPYSEIDHSPKQEMDAFDALPKVIRTAIANCPCELSAPSAIEALRNGTSTHEIVKSIGDLGECFIVEAYRERGMLA